MPMVTALLFMKTAGGSGYVAQVTSPVTPTPSGRLAVQSLMFSSAACWSVSTRQQLNSHNNTLCLHCLYIVVRVSTTRTIVDHVVKLAISLGHLFCAFIKGRYKLPTLAQTVKLGWWMSSLQDIAYYRACQIWSHQVKSGAPAGF